MMWRQANLKLSGKDWHVITLVRLKLIMGRASNLHQTALQIGYLVKVLNIHNTSGDKCN